MVVTVIVLRACLHQIGHYGGLDIASPQSGKTIEQSLSFPTLRMSLIFEESPRDKYRLGILLWVSSLVEALLPVSHARTT